MLLLVIFGSYLYVGTFNSTTGCEIWRDTIDLDNDGIPDYMDNCPDIYNPDQTNSDEDSYGNACDNCWYVNNPDQEDSSGDYTWCSWSSPACICYMDDLPVIGDEV